MTLVVALLMLPVQLYLSFSYYANLKSHSQKRAIIPIILLTFYAYPLIALIDFYTTSTIDLLSYPQPLVYWFWFGLIFVFQLATWVIVTDLIKVITNYFYGDKNVISRWHPHLIVALFATIFLFTATKTYLHTTQVQAKHHTIPVENLPKSLQGLKIVHISDIQGDEYTGRNEIRNYIQQINTQNPDLIIFTGDLISYGTDFIEMSAEELGKAKSKYGTIAIVGDHDYWAGVPHVKKALNNQSIPLLQDENYTIQIDSTTKITITGVTEVYSKQSDSSTVDSLTKSASDSALKIFASHQVNDQLIAKAQQQNYHLVLSGHTHGGQIHVPFMGMNFSASQQETKYVQGLYNENGLPINVNNGLGFTLAPIRYEAPPNISIITLQKE
ncbi:metallophosphoesterase [Fodinibius sp.]|uniref:metallophosphoesterase n=1 Tax=Fodinibius sp. TaxID=1872440 RepID=UPI002ACE89C0|nr:metallophosphoesterase [Fodinibius sp.]